MLLAQKGDDRFTPVRVELSGGKFVVVLRRCYRRRELSGLTGNLALSFQFHFPSGYTKYFGGFVRTYIRRSSRKNMEDAISRGIHTAYNRYKQEDYRVAAVLGLEKFVEPHVKNPEFLKFVAEVEKELVSDFSSMTVETAEEWTRRCRKWTETNKVTQ